ncbi:transposase family protein [Streptomyces sp. 6N223]
MFRALPRTSSASCPRCGENSERVHGRYERRWAGCRWRLNC